LVFFQFFSEFHPEARTKYVNQRYLLGLGVTVVTILGLAIGWLAEGSTPTTATKLKEGSGRPEAPSKIGNPSFLSPHASPIAVLGNRVFVVNTPADTVDVINKSSGKVGARIDVGIDPVGLALRPDGKELWVSNHISDSVSVIDIDPESPTDLCVVATIQDFDLQTKATRFDEPVGIAFASNKKAYIALSSENQIAVVDVAERKVTKRLKIPAQDPRVIKVRNGRLYVIPFESNNKTQLSGGYKVDGDLVTFNAHQHSIAVNNVLSLGHVTDIVKHPRVPDRDLFVFDTVTDQLIETVDSLGTLLYGMTVDSQGRVFVAQTDARNDVNGRAGSKKHSLVELENRAFLNQITSVEFNGDDAEKPEFFNLEPLPPQHPKKGEALATPFAIEISKDDSLLVATAAASDKVFTVNPETGDILGRVEVDAVPRGIALESDRNGKARRAWVLNAVENTVSVVNLANPASPKTESRIRLEDPTHPVFKRGRIAFETAKASTTGTFACASCHPGGHTDQLLWVLKTPIVTGGNQIMPRSTMPIRGLRDTAPFHWDGIPGDPYGGINSASTRAHVPPNSSVKNPESAARHLIDGGLASTMAMVGDKTKNDEGRAGLLSRQERDDMARFLLGVSYPPAQRRAYTNVLSKKAKEGFELFHIKGDVGGTPGSQRCGDCHRMPFLVSTNTPGSGMDAPTWRGAYDRFLILPQGRLNIIDFDFYRRVAEDGNDERRIWQFSWAGRRTFDPVWDMVLEGSTGFSGSFSRQVTINQSTFDDELTIDLLDALEASAAEGAIVLQVEGASLLEGQAKPVKFQFDALHMGGSYVEVGEQRRVVKRKKLISLASKGRFVGTFTGRHGAKDDFDFPQPALWTHGPIEKQRGRQEFPVLYGEYRTLEVSGRHLEDEAHIIVDGRRVAGTVKVRSDDDETVEIALDELPEVGLHFLQLQNPCGLFSNDFIFHVAQNEDQAEFVRHLDHTKSQKGNLHEAIERGDLVATRWWLDRGASSNERNEDGATPLSTAAFQGHIEIAKLLIEKGARVSVGNRDGNTPLHVAAFMCRVGVVDLLLKNGASVRKKNLRGETPADVVVGAWSEQLAGIYRAFSAGGNLDLDLEQIRNLRPKLAHKLREAALEKN
jgi:YVTN family beta-propeller protein